MNLSKFMKPSLILALLALIVAPFAGRAAESTSDHDARMAWFRDARFGLFIHWGVYAVPAGEWGGKTNYGEWFLEETKMPVSQYEKFASQFNPVKFDAKEWVRLAKEAGMKYIVITSKHHDGFGIYPSGQTDWCIKSTPFKRDPLQELADACRAAGIRLCFYHSIMDWHHADWETRRAWNDKVTGTPDMDRYTAYMKAQIKELITRYGPIGILWFDGEWEKPWTHERGMDLYKYVRSLQPDIIINNRVGKGRAGMSGMDKGAERAGDYGTPEQEIPPTGFGPGVDWESCMTMNNHWGYNKNDQNWKSSTTLIRNLVDCASKGGNYLLNIGPTSEGVFPDASIERLHDIGRWMKVNHEAIYGTQASPFEKLAWGRCTQKKIAGPAAAEGFQQHAAWPFQDPHKKSGASQTRLYLFVYDWPANGRLVVPGLANKPVRAFLLDGRQALPFTAANNSVTISIPAAAPDKNASVIALDIQGSPEIVKPGPLRRRDARAAGRPDGLVARLPLWHVHPLGRLFRPRRHLQWQTGSRHRRVDYASGQNPHGRIPPLRHGVQPDQVQRRRVGAHRKGCGHEIHRHHLKAPRRLRHVRLQGVGLEHCPRLAVQARPVAGTCRRLPEARAEARLLLLPGPGLEQWRVGGGR